MDTETDLVHAVGTWNDFKGYFPRPDMRGDSSPSLPTTTPELCQLVADNVSGLHSEHLDVQRSAATMLGRIAGCNSALNPAGLVVEGGALPPLVKLLESESAPVRERAVWALGELLVEYPLCRYEVLQLRGLFRVIRLLEPGVSDTPTLISAMRTLRLLLQKTPFTFVKAALSPIAQIVKTCNIGGMVEDACWALAYASGGGPDSVHAVASLDMCPRLVELARRGQNSVDGDAWFPALLILGNIISGDNDQMQRALDAGALDVLVSLLADSRFPDRHLVRKEVCWALSNVTAGTPQQIELALRAGAFPRLLETMACEGDDHDIRAEACIAVSNAIMNGTDAHVRALCSMGVIGSFRAALALRGADHMEAMVEAALEGMQKIRGMSGHLLGQDAVTGTDLEVLQAELASLTVEDETGGGGP